MRGLETKADEMEQSVSIEPYRPILEAILETPAEAIVATDRDGNVIFWNPGATRVFGFTVGEALGGSLDLIIPDRLRARHWDGFRKAVAAGRSRYGEGELLSVPAMTKSGDKISV